MDSKSALLQAAQAAVVGTPPRLPTRKPHRSGRRGFLPLLLVVGAACGALLVSQPSWLRTPPPAPESPAIVDASARMTLLREAERVRSFRDSQGRLPATIVEAGGPAGGEVVYTPCPDGSFTLRMATDARLVLRSTDDVKEFLGTSYESLIERRSR